MKRGPRAPSRVIADARTLGVPLSRPQASGLIAFGDLLLDRAVGLGLVAEGDAAHLYQRHVLDSLRAAAVFGGADRLACDLGSGAGLPGVVLAVAVPWCRFVLIEPRRKAVAFLELAIERLDISNAEVLAGGAEEARLSADVATARALAPVDRTWLLAAPLLRRGGRLVYFAGASLEPARIRRTPGAVVASHGSLVIMTKS